VISKLGVCPAVDIAQLRDALSEVWNGTDEDDDESGGGILVVSWAVISSSEMEAIEGDIGGDTGSLASGAEVSGEEGRAGDIGFGSIVFNGVSGGEIIQTYLNIFQRLL
jgi:hypothetical protein